MDNRGGTSIDELMRQPNNSNMSEDESIVNSILNELNSDKEQQINMGQQHLEQASQQQQIMEKQNEIEIQQRKQHEHMMKQNNDKA